MAKSSIKVSQSRVKIYRKCHRAHYNRYVLRLRRKKVGRPLQFGRIAHDVVEAYAEGDDPFEEIKKIDLKNKRLFTAEREMYGELIQDITDIMAGYFEYWNKDGLIYLRRNRKNAEHYFEIEIADGIILIGYIDNIAKTPNNLKWLVERKTFKKRPREDDRWRNMQSTIYVRANDMMGWPKVDGICWDYIYSKPPAVPAMLKSGDFSKKKLVTLPVVIRRFLKENKLSAKKYQSLIHSAEQTAANYFYRVFTPVNESLVTTVFQEFIDTSLEILDNTESKKDRSIDQHCGWCDYEPMCRAELMGMDVDYVIGREYETSDEQKAREKSKEKSKEKKHTRKKAPAKVRAKHSTSRRRR